jgi:hypothetical protein
MGGYYSFRIIDMIRYREYLYKNIELILDKFPKNELVDSIKSINFKSFFMNPWVYGIGTTIIATVVLLVFIIPHINSVSPQLNYSNTSIKPANLIILPTQQIMEGQSVLIFSNQVRLDMTSINGYVKTAYIKITFPDTTSESIYIIDGRDKFMYNGKTYLIDMTNYRGNIAEITISEKQ